MGSYTDDNIHNVGLQPEKIVLTPDQLIKAISTTRYILWFLIGNDDSGEGPPVPAHWSRKQAGEFPSLYWNPWTRRILIAWAREHAHEFESDEQYLAHLDDLPDPVEEFRRRLYGDEVAS